MERYSYLVLGSGVGKAVAWWLIRQKDTAKVMLTDISEDRAFLAADDIRPEAASPASVRARALDVEHADLRAASNGYDVIVSALPARYNLELAQDALRNGKHFCDLGGVVQITRDMLGMHGPAKSAGVSVIPDCGLMPGLGMVMAQHLLDALGTLSPTSIIITVGGLPQRPELPSNYQRIYSAEGLEHLCFDKAPVVREGKVIGVSPFSEVTRLVIPELLQVRPEFPFVEAFPTSGASVAPWTFAERGVRRFEELTIRWPGFVDAFGGLSREAFMEAVSALPRTDHQHPDLIFMDVSVAEAGPPNRQLSYRLLDRFEPRSGLSAMERATGFSAAAVARMQARGETSSGVLTPERAMDSGQRQEYLEEMQHWLRIQFIQK